MPSSSASSCHAVAGPADYLQGNALVIANASLGQNLHCRACGPCGLHFCACYLSVVVRVPAWSFVFVLKDVLVSGCKHMLYVHHELFA